MSTHGKRKRCAAVCTIDDGGGRKSPPVAGRPAQDRDAPEFVTADLVYVRKDGSRGNRSRHAALPSYTSGTH